MGSIFSKTNATNKEETHLLKGAPIVVICSSSGEESITGIKRYINENMASHLKSARLVFKLLPFNEKDMKEFNFHGIEALILCHSVEIRGPLSSIYDKFLKKAKDCLGKKKVAAIVHDYKIPLEAHESYDNKNKSNFKMASLVLSLSQRSGDAGEIQMTEEQEDRFILFFNMFKLAVQALPYHKKISRAFYRFFYRVIICQ